MLIYLIILILINLFSFFDIVKIPKIAKKIIYILMALILILLVGFRGEVGTDSGAYIKAFDKISKITIDPYDVNYIYTDKGFIMLTSILKKIYNNNNFYFLVISFSSITCLFFSLYKITNYLMLGILVYYIRFFFLRDFNQIRSGLSIVILLLTIKYIKERELIKFIKFNFLSFFIHKSSVMWTLCYKIFNVKLSKKQIFFILFFCFTINIFIYKYILKFNFILEKFGMPRAYTTGEYGFGASLGYKNPILYYQLTLFFLFICLEKKISGKWSYYCVIRNIYLMSICTFIILMPWLSLAGRTSSIFATVEIFLIPSFLYAFKNKITINFILLIVLNLIAYYNIFIRLGSEYIYF